MPVRWRLRTPAAQPAALPPFERKMAACSEHVRACAEVPTSNNPRATLDEANIAFMANSLPLCSVAALACQSREGGTNQFSPPSKRPSNDTCWQT
jgi:hypothetical protein